LEKYQYYIRRFIKALGIIGICAAVFVALLVMTFPKITEISRIKGDIKTQQTTLSDTERKIMELKSKAEGAQAGKKDNIKTFYHSLETGDSESIMAEELGDALAILKRNKIKTRSIKYEYDPQSDPFIKNAKNKFSACTLNLDMVADYRAYLNFLRDLYRHEHFMNIGKVEIVPYARNKKILLINMQLTLYAQKKSADSSPAPGASLP
jgi:hypothetical protein